MGVQSDFRGDLESGINPPDTLPRSRRELRGDFWGIKHGFTGVPPVWGYRSDLRCLLRCLARKNDVPPVHNDTRCFIMILSFEPTKIGFFIESANNYCFNNWYKRID